MNRLLKRRGPDLTTVTKLGKYTLVHNLLSITGEGRQPFYSGDLVCVYNGEIYNYGDFGDFKSDGESILPAFRLHGERLHTVLDGEFSILIYDRSNDKVWTFTDAFGTKPLYNLGNSFATYPQAIGGGTRVRSEHQWDLNQHKDTFDDWTRAFEEAILKRASTTKGLFIGLSAGYDSGTIACALDKFNFNYEKYSVLGKENELILSQRNPDKAIKWDNAPLSFLYGTHVTENVPNWQTMLPHDPGKIFWSVHTDPASAKLSWVCDQADGLVYLSGQGADEIFADYGHNGKKHYPHSNFGGLFPDDLSSIFPWPSFYGGTMEAYLMKEECVAGSFGKETRYPFLDKAVVQEFLWLKPELKNKWYKSVLHNYMSEHKYPFAEGVKVGF